MAFDQAIDFQFHQRGEDLLHRLPGLYGKLGFGSPFKCMICGVEKAEGGPDFETGWPAKAWDKAPAYLER